MKKQKATKESVLKVTHDGLLFYKFVIPKLKVQGDKCRNVTNPFYSDNKPSLSIFYLNGVWYFKDHGDYGYKGDVFVFASIYFGLDCNTDFNEILELMSELDYSEIENSDVTVTPIVSNKHFELKRRENDMFKPFELKYFEKYGITENILKEYRVVPIDGFKATYSNNKWYSVNRENKQVMVAYPKNGYAKIYSPNPKTFKSVGNKTSEYIFGKEVIDKNDVDFVFLTGGEKDVLTLASLGYYAFCTNSETVEPSKELLDEFSNKGITVYSFLDNDETGFKQSENLKTKFSIQPLSLPLSIIEQGGKDISDYVMNGLTKTKFDKVVNKLRTKTIEMKKNEKNSNEIENNLEPFPASVFENLPPFLHKCCDKFDNLEEKSIILLSSITITSGAIRNVSTEYDKTVRPNLFTFIVGTPSSGKGVVDFVKYLVNKIHIHLRSLESDPDKKQSFFLPANSSSAVFLKRLDANNGYGCIFETEADTLSETLGKEWGDFSTILRAAFHNESVRSERMDYSREIEYTNISTMLTGTPMQPARLFKSVENGLFSRFLFFCLSSKNQFKNKFKSNGGINFQKYYTELGDDVFDFYMKLDNLDYNIEILLTEQQQDLLVDFFDARYDLINQLGEEIVATINRLAVVALKMLMNFTIIRYIGKNEEEIPFEIICRDEDFITVFEMIECLLKHSVYVYKTLPRQNTTSGIRNPQKLKFYNALPDKFSRQDANAKAKSIGLNLDTIDTYLTQLVKDGQIFRLKNGSYSKTEVK